MTSAEYRELVELLGRQLTEIDGRFTEVGHRFTEVGHRFTQMDTRFAELRDHMDARFAEVFGHFDEIYRRLERLEQEYHAITQALRRIEGLLADEQGRRAMVERDLVVLKQQVAALQLKIEEIEQRLRS